MMMKQGGLARIAALLVVLGLLAAEPVMAQSAPPEITTSEHIVQPGETLPALAARYRTEVATLLRLNGLHDPRAIYPGQRLRYPAPTGAPPPISPRGGPIAPAGANRSSRWRAAPLCRGRPSRRSTICYTPARCCPANRCCSRR